jgi:phosphatidylserine decarboxylase precursor-related protein
MRNFLSYEFFTINFFILLIIAAVTKSTRLVILFSIFVAFISYFYRYKPLSGFILPNTYVISPSEGTILAVQKRDGFYYIAIFLSPLDKHYQLYPCNCVAIERLYDATGKYNIVMNLTKSRFNEKMMHLLQMKNGEVIKLTQIAGFLPRRITSDNSINEDRLAGQYLGMIEFGSRVDLEIPMSRFNIKLGSKDIGRRINYGDIIGVYS